MTISAIDLASPLRGVASLVRELHVRSSGAVLLETVFKYPDGTSIEVEVGVPSAGGEVVLSDLAQTTAWLLNLRVKPWLSAKRRALQADALLTYGVEREGGELRLRVAADAAALADGVVRLAQACLRTADLMFTRRTSIHSSFAEEIEDLLADSDLPYETDVELPGRQGKLVRVDFSVHGGRTRSLVMTLASQSVSAAKARATGVFCSFYDLKDASRAEQFVTLFDDRSSAIREEDLKRLEELSQVVPYSDAALFRSIVAA
jgi:hypothetical protein